MLRRGISKTAMALMIVAIIVVGVAGYFIGYYTAPRPAPVKKIRIGYITRLAVPWWIVAEAGFKKAARDYNFEALIYHPSTLTVEEQVRVMESWIAMGIDGIFIGPNDPSGVIDVINEAIDKGIPVLCGYGVDSPESKRLLFVGYDPYDLGKALGWGIVTLLQLEGKTTGTISYHTGSMVSTEDVASWEGFQEVVQAAGYTVVGPILDGGDAALAVALAETTIEQYPDLVGMLGYYDYCGPAIGRAITERGKIGQIIGHADGLIGADLPYFENGAVRATIELRQYEGSYLAGEILYKLVTSGRERWNDVLRQYVPEYPAKKEILLPFGWITAERLEVQPIPEIGWIMTLSEFAAAFPEEWEIITAS
ncbi:MAG: substrate-binding domain-containing protein [Candidatus Bathyarchaeia archaeon]